MNRKQQLNKVGATPGKLALIGVLSLVLVMVIVRQLPERQEESSAPAPTAKPTSEPVANRTTHEIKKNEENDSIAPWPEVTLAEALAHDPFAPPSWVARHDEPTDSTEKVAGELKELQEQGASIVVTSEKLKSATIGEQVVRVGDVLEGYTVTDITTQGVFLNKRSPR